jgi:hypothetical protein
MIRVRCDSGSLNYALDIALIIGKGTIIDLGDGGLVQKEAALKIADELEAASKEIRDAANGLSDWIKRL